MPKVLISDQLSSQAVEIFRARGIEVDFEPELGGDPARLAGVIGQYDGLAVRSATNASAGLIARADNLKVIGRAGIGVDNIDLAAASARGIVVMNTPFGNSITAAEHAIAMLFASARMIPQANASTHAGKWEKSKFIGVEITGNTLGLIGCGNIGSVVAARAVGLKMKVIAYDPFLNANRARELGVEKIDNLDQLLARADFVSLHTALTDETHHLMNARRLGLMKQGAYLINTGRGSLIDEAALVEALKAGHLGGAGLDVYEREPELAAGLADLANVTLLPHIGSATTETRAAMGLRVKENLDAYRDTGAPGDAVV